MNKNPQEQPGHMAPATEDKLFDTVVGLIDQSHQQVAKAINTTMVYTYYAIGQYIVEFQQKGNLRADYGKGVLKRLSERLTERFGNGWSVDTLEKCRTFFKTYSISAPEVRKSDGKKKSAPVVRIFHNSYALCLPQKEELQQRVIEWIQEYNNNITD